MAQMKFTKGGDTFTFVDGRKYPISDPVQVNVVVGYSEGKQLYAYNKGMEEQFFNLDLDRICQTDRDNVVNWLENIAVGPLNTFTFTDEDETDHTVRMMTDKDPFKEVNVGQFSGTVILRKEI